MIDYKDYYIRPIKKSDLKDLFILSGKTGVGFTSLPEDKKFLAAKIAKSLDSFSQVVDDRYYFLALYSKKQKKIIGVSAILNPGKEARPNYHYKVSTIKQVHPPLEISFEHEVLHLVNDYQNVGAICTLFLEPENRKGGLGALLSLSRFLFIANNIKLFNDMFIADMRGVFSDDLTSPLWNALGRNFFNLSYDEADRYSGLGHKQFIIDLMPKYPIYTNLLTKAAQNCIGKVHNETKNALKFLQSQGFVYKNYIDIFDGGPTVEVHKENIYTIRKSVLSSFEVSQEEITDGSMYMLANTSLDFRCVLAKIIRNDNSIVIDKATCANLNIKPDDKIRIINFKDR